MDKDFILKLTGSVYGLRNAPRAWYKRVRADLESLGWRVHQLDQCVFMLYDKGELVGTCGVYVDDFIIAGKVNDPRWRKAKESLRNLYKWGNGKRTHSRFAESGISRRVTTQCRWTSRTSPESCTVQTFIFPRT